MGIFMYDVKFGDCFQLTGDLFPTGLVVDFGSLSNIPSKFDEIIAHFNDTKPSKLLLSHYHLDHLSGLLHMMETGQVYKFKEVLIPDIFSTRGLNRAIVLFFLEDFLESCYLPKCRGRQYTLLEFVKYLCNDPIKVKLLKRGDTFERINKLDTCTVLWPDEKYIVDYADTLLRSFDLASTTIEGLITSSDMITNLISSLAESGENINREQYRETLLTIQTQLDEVFGGNNLEDQLLIHRTVLKDFKHMVNIVFHNSVSGDINYLFTGDIEKKAMKLIETNLDKKPELDLHNKYRYIKIPHHGTKNHFYDYSAYSPINILIPNGKSKCLNSYKITKDYSTLYSIDSKMYCSNCNWCEQWEPSRRCCCSNRKIIWTDVQKFIT